MTKNLIFLSFLILNSSFLICSIPAQAIDPVIIKKADYGASPLNKPLPRRSDYFSNDIDSVDTVKCSDTYSISQTFEPDITTTTTTDPNTGQTIQTETVNPYDVTKIVGAFLPVKDRWTNTALDDFRRFISNRPKAISGNLADIRRGRLSLDPNKTVGASNAARRTIPNRFLRCQRGQRMVEAVQLTYGGEEGTNTDEQVAWKCGGDYKTVVDFEKAPGCDPVLISDIAIAMNQNPFLDLGSTDPSANCTIGTTQTYVFYNPELGCGSTDPALGPNTLETFASAPSSPRIDISPEVACGLYRATVEPNDIGSNARKVKTCSLDNGEKVDCETKKTSIPWGGSHTYVGLANMVKPKSQAVPEKDICTRVKNSKSRNKPNPLSFVKFVAMLFGTITDTAKTYEHPLTYDFFIDKRIQAGISADEVMRKNLIPAKIQKKLLSAPQQYASTDDYGKTFDPGNPWTGMVYTKGLLPKTWQ